MAKCSLCGRTGFPSIGLDGKVSLCACQEGVRKFKVWTVRSEYGSPEDHWICYASTSKTKAQGFIDEKEPDAREFYYLDEIEVEE